MTGTGAMDRWKWFSLTRKYHAIDNPTNEEKLDQLVEALGRASHGRMLDIASGNAELLCRMAERHGSRGVGVEISPYRHADATNRVRERGLAELITLVHGRGQDYRTPAESFDIACCLGASWVFDGYRPTLEALGRWVRPGGCVVSGEPFWIKDPPAEFDSETAEERATFGTHRSNSQAGEELGLELICSLASSVDDWDRYESLSWQAADEYLRENPDDPDAAEIRAEMRKYRTQYLNWGRDCLGWAIYVFRK